MKILLLKSYPALGLFALFTLAFWTDPSGHYFNVPGFLFVIVGTFLGVALGQSPRRVLASVFGLRSSLAAKPEAEPADIEWFLRVAEFHRHGNVRMAEQSLCGIRHPFLRDGARLVIDRIDYADLTRILQWKMGAQREKDQEELQVFRTMMTFAPAMGMLGSLLGLINMLYGLDANLLERIGESMGFAMLTTVYGLVLANLVLRPIVSRLEARSRDRMAWIQVQFETTLMLYEKQHARVIREYLHAFLAVPAPEDRRAALQPGFAESL